MLEDVHIGTSLEKNVSWSHCGAMAVVDIADFEAGYLRGNRKCLLTSLLALQNSTLALAYKNIPS